MDNNIDQNQLIQAIISLLGGASGGNLGGMNTTATQPTQATQQPLPNSLPTVNTPLQDPMAPQNQAIQQSQDTTAKLDKAHANIMKLLMDQRANGIPTDNVMRQLEQLRSKHIVPGLTQSQSPIAGQSAILKQNQQDTGSSSQQNPVSQFANAVGQGAGIGWDDFVNAAQKVAKAADFPLSVLLGQAAVETGRNGMNAPGNNWFGIKGSGNAGSNNLATQEANPNGQFYGENSNFAAYNSPEDSINSYINLIKQNYPNAYAVRNNPVSMIQAIKQGGYATDPNYVQKVTSTPEFRGNISQPTHSVLGTSTTRPNSGLASIAGDIQNLQSNPLTAYRVSGGQQNIPPPVPAHVSPIYQRTFTQPKPAPQPQAAQPNFFQNVGNAIGGATKGVENFFGFHA